MLTHDSGSLRCLSRRLRIGTLPPMPKIKLPHAHLFYAHTQPADARYTLLLIHGAGSSHLIWPAELRRLPQTAVYALDLAGHGRSALPGYDSVQLHARDVLDFITALSLSQVVVLGHSMGGAVAQMVGLAQSPAVAGLVLLGTGAKLRVSPAILESIRGDYEQAVGLLSQFYWGEKQNPALIEGVRGGMLACPVEVTMGDFLACDQFDLRTSLPEITVPTLVISGSADQMTPPQFGQFLADQLPNAEFTLIEQGGHMMALEFPNEVARLVADFLANVA